ncbi:MAG: hypothetical protein HY321_09120 [Armatimonadetes bacterium]|nr:hypothetical protein [Armatimonadota bacterium]
MRYTRWIVAAVLALGVAGAALAQGPGATNPERARMRQQMEKFREQHKYTVQVTSTLRAIGEMDEGTKCPLTPAQAKKVVAAIAPYKAKAKFTQDDAKTVLKGIKAALNTKQLTELGQITKRMEERRGPGGGGPGGGGPGGGPGMRPGGGGPGGGGPGSGPPGARPGGGGPGGGSQPGGQRPRAALQKDYNPFAKPASKDDRFGQRRYERMKETLDALEKKAKQK